MMELASYLQILDSTITAGDALAVCLSGGALFRAGRGL